MPAPCPAIRPEAEELVCAWARRLRALRQELKVSTRETAEAAGRSRVTLHRIERGNPSVTVGAYAAVDAALRSLNARKGTAVIAGPTVPSRGSPNSAVWRGISRTTPRSLRKRP